MTVEGVGLTEAVDQPPVLAPAHTLLSTVPTLNTPDGRWEGGFEYLPEECGEASGWAPCGEDPFPGGLVPPLGEDADPDAALVRYRPWLVYAEHVCSTWAYRQMDYEGRVRRLLDRTQSAKIERELVVATEQPLNPSITSVATTLGNLLGTYGSPHLALAAVENVLASCHTLGVILASPGLVSLLVENGSIVEKGVRLVTAARGDYVVAAAGLVGLDADTEVIAAASMVYLRLGDVEVPGTEQQRIDRATNTVDTRAQRVVGAAFDPCCAAIAHVAPIEPT